MKHSSAVSQRRSQACIHGSVSGLATFLSGVAWSGVEALVFFAFLSATMSNNIELYELLVNRLEDVSGN